MTISISSSNFSSSFTSDNTVATLVLPTDVPADAAIVIGGWGGTSLVSVSDPVNGTWGTTPNDQLGESRGFFSQYLTGSSALTGSSNRTITVTFGSTGNKFLVGGWFTDDGGVATFQAYVDTLNTGNNTTHDTNTIALTGAGAIVALAHHNNAVTFTADGAGESVLEAASSERVLAVGEVVASASTVGIELTSSGNTDSRSILMGFLEPAAASAPTISSVTPSTLTAGSNPVIAGSNFEASQGTGTVKLSPTDNVADAAAVTQSITSWGDTEITLDGVSFPTGTSHNDTLYLFVTNNSSDSNAAGEAVTASIPSTPAITSVNGGSAIARGATGVSIVGTDLSAVTGVTIGGVAQTGVSAAATEVTFNLVQGGLKYGTDYTLEITDGTNTDTATVQLTPPAGYTYFDVASLPWGVGEVSIFDGASPAVANGDQAEVETTTSLGSTLTWNTDGTYTIGPPAGSHQFDARVWDATDSTWGAFETFTADSNEAPTVTISTSPGTYAWKANVPLAASATDAEDGDISANIVWTSNLDGALGTGATLNLTDLSAGSHTITATITDSGSLQDTDTVAITVNANQAPVVTISTSPGNRFQGANVNLAASATDLEDGDISASITWSSNVDGALGTGSSINVNTLTLGEHTITASITDSDSANDTDTVVITIVEAPEQLPTFPPRRGDAATLAFIAANVGTPTGDLAADFREACRSAAGITGGSLDDVWKKYLEAQGYTFVGLHPNHYD